MDIDKELLLRHDEEGNMIVHIEKEEKNIHMTHNKHTIMSKKSVALEMSR